MAQVRQFDLVDEMQWEDVAEAEGLTGFTMATIPPFQSFN